MWDHGIFGALCVYRGYMAEFQEKQSSDMMNLKVKIQNATAICRRVAKFYSINLEEGKPEHLFVVIEQFVSMLQSSKRALLKLEKERYALCGLLSCSKM